MQKARLIAAWVMLIFAIVSWPLASFVFAKHEPQFVIALSELALIFEAFNAIQITNTRKDVES